MLTYNFTNIGSDSMYEYLYKCIKNDILQGTLQAGEKLPSKRSFAKNLGISVITVENAYEQLIAEGYIYSMPKRGFYVTDFKGVLETKQREEVQEIIPMTSGENRERQSTRWKRRSWWKTGASRAMHTPGTGTAR